MGPLRTKYYISYTGYPGKVVIIRSSWSEVFCKKGVPKNFAKFTGNYLGQSLFLNKVSGLTFNEYKALNG